MGARTFCEGLEHRQASIIESGFGVGCRSSLIQTKENCNAAPSGHCHQPRTLSSSFVSTLPASATIASTPVTWGMTATARSALQSSCALFSEDWESGIDLEKWLPYGEPRPSLYPGQGMYGSTAMDSNGDSYYDSGLIARTPLDITSGITVEFWLRGYGEAWSPMPDHKLASVRVRGRQQRVLSGLGGRHRALPTVHGSVLLFQSWPGVGTLGTPR